jgi:lipopolysaccharide biosynthesis glycosyltransferase
MTRLIKELFQILNTEKVSAYDLYWWIVLKPGYFVIKEIKNVKGNNFMSQTSSPVVAVFAANNYYVPYMAATMQSIMENAGQNRLYIFYILHQEISYDNIELLKKQTAPFPQFSVEFINVTQYISKYNFFTSRHITVETYFRLLIPELLGECRKVIYLDCDMICCTDIASLLDIDLENYLLAAVRDSSVALYYKNHTDGMKSSSREILLNLKNPSEYFCAGMCVINIELFRKTIPTDKLLELAASRKWPFHDQDILNYLCEGKTLLLPYHWALMLTSDAEYLPEYLQNEYHDAEKNPKIIHYKPWNRDTYTEYFEFFWKYACRTPFISVIIDRMKSRGLISYGSFDQRIISNIKHRKGIGLRFILVDCLKAWLFRDKKK